MNDTDDLLAQMYAPSTTTARPEAVSIDPRPRDAGYVTLVGADGRPCAFMGFDLAEHLGWIEPTP